MKIPGVLSSPGKSIQLAAAGVKPKEPTEAVTKQQAAALRFQQQLDAAEAKRKAANAWDEKIRACLTEVEKDSSHITKHVKVTTYKVKAIKK